MEVVAKQYIVIESPIEKYYLWKKKYSGKKCPTCGQGKLHFFEENRRLNIKCDTPLCEKNMSIPFQSYITYDVAYDISKQQYIDSVRKVLKRKFDYLFNYTTDKDIHEIKTAYVGSKEQFDDLTTQYHTRELSRMEELTELKKSAKERRDELKIALREHQDIQDIQEDTNDILNKIHQFEYMKLGNENILYSPFFTEIKVN